MNQSKNDNIRTKLFFENTKRYIFLAFVLMATVGGMLVYQLVRQDPVTVEVKDARGYVTSQIVHKKPNETVKQVVEKADCQIDNTYVSNVNMDEKISATDSVKLTETISGTINVDGQSIAYTSGAHTIKELLDEKGISIGNADIVTPKLSEVLTSTDANISITRVTEATENLTEAIAYPIVTQQNSSLAAGTNNILQQGKDGVRSYTVKITYNNGVEAGRTILSEQRTEPVSQIVEVGTDMTQVKPTVAAGDIEGWRPYVILALQANGLEATEARVTRVLNQIKSESDGNQAAMQQVIDINSINGTPAQGLMQTIPSTFEAYKFAGYDDILNGYHNLLAAIHYAKTVYGDDLTALGNGHGY